MIISGAKLDLPNNDGEIFLDKINYCDYFNTYPFQKIIFEKYPSLVNKIKSKCLLNEEIKLQYPEDIISNELGFND